MSAALGPQSVEHLGGSADQRFLQAPQLIGERGYSERTQQIIDQEVGELLRRAFERAVALLEHNRAQLLALAARLREKEVIEGDELRTALEGAEAPPALQGPDELQWAQLRTERRAHDCHGTALALAPRHARCRREESAEADPRASRRGRSRPCS